MGRGMMGESCLARSVSEGEPPCAPVAGSSTASRILPLCLVASTSVVCTLQALEHKATLGFKLKLPFFFFFFQKLTLCSSLRGLL